MEHRLNKSGCSTLLAAVLAGPLVLLPIGSHAASIAFDDPMTILYGNTIIGNGKHTQLDMDFTAPQGVLLAMDAGSAPGDEYFAFRMKNSTGITVEKLSIAFIKPAGAVFTNTPSYNAWSVSVLDKWGRVEVDQYNLNIVETPNSVRVELPFLPGAEWYSGQTVYLTQYWNSFNSPRADWLLDINLNDTSRLIANPLPAAVWLFGSGLAGLLVVAVRKRAG